MVQRLASVSAIPSLSCSWTIQDEGSRLWHYRDYHTVSGTGANGKKGRKNAVARRRTNKSTVKKRRKPGKTPPNTDSDDYYLRWNPSGDYDSDDDDWWKEVMAMERRDRNKEKKKEKKAAADAAKQEEEDMYLRYKKHTTRVMEWGNSLWVERYGGSVDEGDSDESRLSLRTMVARLGDLAADGVAMSLDIYHDLENAIALRDEFQARYVSQRINQKREKETRMARQNKSNSTKPSKASSLSPSSSPTNGGKNKTASDDGVEKIDDGTPPKSTINDNTTSMAEKLENHQWILNQLKVLLRRFRYNSNARNVISDHSSSDHSSIVTKASGDSESSNVERSLKILTGSPTAEECLPESNMTTTSRDKNCDEPSYFRPGKDDDTSTTIKRSFSSSSSTSLPVPAVVDNQGTCQLKNCEESSSLYTGKEDDADTEILPSCSLSSSKSLPLQTNQSKLCTTKAVPEKGETEHLLYTLSADRSKVTMKRKVKEDLWTVEYPILPKHGQENDNEDRSGDIAEGNQTPNQGQTTETSNKHVLDITFDEILDNTKCTGPFSITNSNPSLEDWEEMFGDDGSLIGSDVENEDDSATTIQSSCQSTPSASVPLPVDASNRFTGHSSDSNSNPSSADWDKIFDDDGSFIGSHVSRDDCPKVRDLEDGSSISTHQEEDKPENLSNSDLLKRGSRFENDKTDQCQTPRIAKIDIPPDMKESCTNILADKGNVLSNSSKKSIQSKNPPQKHKDSPACGGKSTGLLGKDENISNDLSQQTTQRQTGECQMNTITIERPPTSNNKAVPASNESDPERVKHSKHYDSVWDVPFFEDEETGALESATRKPVQTCGVSLPNSETPEDWEMLFEEEEKGKGEQEEDSINEEEISPNTSSRENIDYNSRVEPANELGGYKIELSPGDKNEAVSSHPNECSRQGISDRLIAKMKKEPYTMAGNLVYDSVWDIFAKDKTNSDIKGADDSAIAKLAFSIAQKTQPDDDWEALYS